LAKLSTEAKSKIPTEVMFAKAGGDKIDIKSSVTVDATGRPIQKISTISGHELELIVKPSSPVNSVTGYLIFNKKAPPQAKVNTQEVALETALSQLVFGVPVFAEPVTEPVAVEEKLVLQEFTYTDPDGDGIFTARITAPVMDGEYEVVTVIDYVDGDLGRKAIHLVTVVDPEGYIYQKIGDQHLRIKNAKATIYWLNSESKKYEVWPARAYSQDNPQTTDVTGRYAFLVPPGNYYIKVEAKNYHDYTSEQFAVLDGSGIHENIELAPAGNWKSLLDWRYGLGLMFGMLFLYILFRFIKLRKRQSK